MCNCTCCEKSQVQRPPLTQKLLEVASILNAFNFIQIAFVGFAVYWIHDLLTFYKVQVVETGEFNETAFLSAIGSLVVAVIGLVKYIYETGANLNKRGDTRA